MTLDDVAAEMRHRFTANPGGPVTITPDEWNVLADAIYLRDALVEITEAPSDESAKAKVAKLVAKHGRR